MESADDNIMNQLISKNIAALEYLINTYGKAVYSLVYRILDGVGSKEDVEDCVSDIFVDVWEKCHQYNPEKGNIKTWLLILAKYKALSRIRKLKATKEIVTENIPETDSNECTESIILSNEALQEVVNAINELRDTDKNIFYRRYFFHENIESIAKAYGLTRQAVDNRLWRCRKFLYEKLFNCEKGVNKNG